ncbi:hypothetical protein CI640_20765 [Escherichia coli]|nr:hypothetical protein [Escherichia coli]OYF84592.1 hypothetical protein CI640_20765 [Escherichia coli]
MSKKSAKKRQPVKPVVAKEPARTAKNFGYEEMLSAERSPHNFPKA